MPTHRAILPHLVTGTFLNVAAVLLGTAIGVTLGRRLPAGLQRQVLAGLGLVTAVIGVDLALGWRDTSALYVLGATRPSARRSSRRACCSASGP